MRIPLSIVAATLFSLMAIGCSDDPEPSKATDDTVVDGSTADGGLDDDGSANTFDAGNTAHGDGGVQDTAHLDDINEDTGEEDEGLVGSCPGGPDCPCTKADECDNAVCIDTHEGKRCAAVCVDACKPGYACQKIGTTDSTFYCVSQSVALCAPCEQDTDCQPNGAKALCLDYGKEGRFCGAACKTDNDCLDGYSCVDGVGSGGAKAKQCRLKKGVCECSAWAKKNAAKTTCSASTDKGSCKAARACSDSGLQACQPKAAAVELCNTIDDDCNGVIDDLPKTATCSVDAFAGTGSLKPCKKDSECTVAGEQCDETAGACRTFIGSCPGTPICLSGGKELCQQNKVASAEKCDLEDNDCDGVTDEGFVATLPDGATGVLGQPCGKGPCAGGKVTCLNVQTAGCSTAFKASKSDICNGLDDDCDGVIDDGACDDGDACTKDSCDAKAKQCGHSKPPDCNDGNVCTSDACEKSTGLCSHVPNNAPCGDGDACTVGDACKGPVCTAGGAKDCTDSEVCTADSCHKIKGCVNLPTQASCTDGDACTNNDACDGGKCKGTPISGCK